MKKWRLMKKVPNRLCTEISDQTLDKYALMKLVGTLHSSHTKYTRQHNIRCMCTEAKRKPRAHYWELKFKQQGKFRHSITWPYNRFMCLGFSWIVLKINNSLMDAVFLILGCQPKTEIPSKIYYIINTKMLKILSLSEIKCSKCVEGEKSKTVYMCCSHLITTCIHIQ